PIGISLVVRDREGRTRQVEHACLAERVEGKGISRQRQTVRIVEQERLTGGPGNGDRDAQAVRQLIREQLQARAVERVRSGRGELAKIERLGNVRRLHRLPFAIVVFAPAQDGLNNNVRWVHWDVFARQ